MKGKKDFDFFDKPASLRRLWIMLYAFCGLTLVPDFFAHRAPHPGVDPFFGFYGLLGFFSCAVLILFSKLVGHFLKKKEDYYDR
jgi:hypothetical protein